MKKIEGPRERMKRRNGARTRRKPLIFIAHRPVTAPQPLVYVLLPEAPPPKARVTHSVIRSSRPAGGPGLADTLQRAGRDNLQTRQTESGSHSHRPSGKGTWGKADSPSTLQAYAT